MSNPNREVFEYRGQHMAEYYNKFFNPNICHVCKSVDRGNLILCDQCCLISYCSEEHKTMHRPCHAKICAVIVQILQVKPQQDTRRFDNWKQWIQSRQELMKSIQERFDDEMEPYMQQMILWSKSCYICHQQANLQVCKVCFSANYCNEHTEVFNRIHNGDKCNQLMLLLNIDIETISGNTTNISYGFLQFVNETSSFVEMLEFCLEYILKRRRRIIDWLAKDYVLSDYLSEPLTVYFGFKISRMLHCLQVNRVVIHIITENFVKRDSIPAWEILLHLVPQIQELLIIMVGSELIHSSDEHILCKRCTFKGKMFSYFSTSMLYHDFVLSEEYTSPSVILMFHAKFDKKDISATIQKITSQSCPLFLSASSDRNVMRNIVELENVLGTNLIPDYFERNYFSGLAPHKDLQTGDTSFRNEYLAIYERRDHKDGEASSNVPRT